MRQLREQQPSLSFDQLKNQTPQTSASGGPSSRGLGWKRLEEFATRNGGSSRSQWLRRKSKIAWHRFVSFMICIPLRRQLRRRSAVSSSDLAAYLDIALDLRRPLDLPVLSERQKAALNALWAVYPSRRAEPNPARKVGEGGEHFVEHHGDGSRVLKHTRGWFGYAIDLDRAGDSETAVIARSALPAEYLARVAAQNAIFGDDIRIEGLNRFFGRTGFVVSQKTIQGCEPSHEEMDHKMASMGFKKVNPAIIGNRDLTDKTWFDPATGWLISDVKPANFKKTPAGDIIPIDVIVQHFPQSGRLHQVLSLNLL